MNFEFAAPSRVIFGNGESAKIGEMAAAFGRSAFLITGRRSFDESSHGQRIRESLSSAAVGITVFNEIKGEPDYHIVDRAVHAAKESAADMVIAVGGGSVLDTGKAVAGLLTNEGVCLDYLESPGGGNTLNHPAAPFIAVPTTAGTGSEATKNAVISIPEKKVKRSVRSRYLLPDIALLDPVLTVSLPKRQTFESGLDAITQLVESYVSKGAQPIPEALCEKGLELAGRSIARVLGDPGNIEARGDMLLAAHLSGMALANSGLGAVHGLASTLGGMCDLPHGLICAALLPHVVRINVTAAEEKYARVGELLTSARSGSHTEGIELLLTYLDNLYGQAGIPATFSHLGIECPDPREVARRSTSSGMRLNPVALSEQQIETLLHAVFEK